MRIKAKGTSFLIGTVLVLDSQEVDAPKADAIYLISINAAEALEEVGEVTPKTDEDLQKQVDEAATKMVTAKRIKK